MNTEMAMSEVTPTPPQGAAQQLPPLVVNIQYVKDLSFEVPNAPQIYTRCVPPRASTSTSTCRPAAWPRARAPSR